jgi:hypothetical protein
MEPQGYNFSEIKNLLTLPGSILLYGYLRIVLFEACSAFTRVTACTLALSPIRDTHSEGFSYFVTSIAAPVASGWSGRRVGLPPTGKRRLSTAHAITRLMHRSKRPWFDRQTSGDPRCSKNPLHYALLQLNAGHTKPKRGRV